MCGSAMLAMDVSSTSMNTAIITVSVMSHGLWRGCHSCLGASDMTLFAVGTALQNEMRGNRSGERQEDGGDRRDKIRHDERGDPNPRGDGKSGTDDVVGGQRLVKDDFHRD